MSVLLVLLVCLLTCCGQLCQKQAVESWRASAQTRRQRFRKMSLWLLTGTAVLGIALLIWLWVLQLLPVSTAYPMLSLNFVLMALCAHYFYRERMTRRHWCGIGCIALGVVLLGVGA